MGIRKSLIGVMLVVSLCLTACAPEPERPAVAAAEAPEKIQIGFSFDSFVIERWQRDRDVFVSAAKKLGAEINVQNANGDVAEQVSQIQYFIDKKMDAIVIVAVEANSLAEVIDDAQKAGIKVIAYDRLILNANVDLYVSFDNEEVGRLMAETLIATIPDDGKVIMINGPTSDNNVALIEQGFKTRIAQTGISIEDSTFCDEWRDEEAFAYINENFEKVRDINGLMCGNDGLAGMAIRGLSERRLAGKIMVVGQDANLDACQRVVEGTQAMTVFKPIDKLAQTAAEYTVLLTQLTTPNQIYQTGPASVETINNGQYLVPYVKIQPIAVTRENMDEVIVESGFHLKEDVYLNILPD